MMAVETNKGGNGTAPATGSPSPASTLAGMPAVAANGQQKHKRRRPSSLMAQAAELPSVERSLDDFIARANETLVDPAEFNTGGVRAAEDEARKEADALRWKAAEHQMRESGAREQSLRRQLDGLQGKLAEAEARASLGTGGPQDGVVADLKVRLSSYDQKLREAEEHSAQLARELSSAKAAQQAVTAAATDSLGGVDSDELEQRARLAEAKATKALAAARAAAAGLTVSAADLAAIESGLVVADAPKKGMSWGGVIAAFIVGGAIMFTVAFVMMNKNGKAAASAAPQQPAAAQTAPAAAPAPAPAAPAKAAAPVVTPIEDDSAAKTADSAAPAAKTDDSAAKADDSAKAPKADDAAAKATDDKAAKAAAAEQAKADKAAAVKAAAEAKAAKAAEAKAAKAAAPKATPHKAAAAPKAEKKASSGALADPFGDTPAPKKKDKKAAGGIVDPF